jgi:hypothetical protein
MSVTFTPDDDCVPVEVMRDVKHQMVTDEIMAGPALCDLRAGLSATHVKSIASDLLLEAYGFKNCCGAHAAISTAKSLLRK